MAAYGAGSTMSAQSASSPSALPDPQHPPDGGRPSYRLVSTTGRQLTTEQQPPARCRLSAAELSCVFANWQPWELTRLRPAIGTSLFLHAAANYTHLVIDSTAERPRQMWERMPRPIAHKWGERSLNLRHVGHRHPDHREEWLLEKVVAVIESHAEGRAAYEMKTEEDKRRQRGMVAGRPRDWEPQGSLETISWEGDGRDYFYFDHLAPFDFAPRCAPSPVHLPALKSIRGLVPAHRVLATRDWRTSALEHLSGSASRASWESTRHQPLTYVDVLVHFILSATRLKELSVDDMSAVNFQQLVQAAKAAATAAGRHEGREGPLAGLESIGIDLLQQPSSAENTLELLQAAVDECGCRPLKAISFRLTSSFVDAMSVQAMGVLERFIRGSRLAAPDAAITLKKDRERYSRFDLYLLRADPSACPSPFVKDKLIEMSKLATEVVWDPRCRAAISDGMRDVAGQLAFEQATRLYIIPDVASCPVGPVFPPSHLPPMSGPPASTSVLEALSAKGLPDELRVQGIREADAIALLRAIGREGHLKRLHMELHEADGFQRWAQQAADLPQVESAHIAIKGPFVAGMVESLVQLRGLEELELRAIKCGNVVCPIHANGFHIFQEDDGRSGGNVTVTAIRASSIRGQLPGVSRVHERAATWLLLQGSRLYADRPVLAKWRPVSVPGAVARFTTHTHKKDFYFEVSDPCRSLDFAYASLVSLLNLPLNELTISYDFPSTSIAAAFKQMVECRCPSSILMGFCIEAEPWEAVWGRTTTEAQLSLTMRRLDLDLRNISEAAGMAALVSLGSDKKLKAVHMELTGVGQEGLQWGQSAERLPAVEYMIIKLDVCRARPTVTSLLQLRGLRELHVYVQRNECVQRAMT
ncbi:unnamed protein product [Vitrella brassicaformis CCMP3155]|uniref:Uncharacterized protein n=2 Tax=Vitrella brassicaformis TaxID=1169539 RepID=A0A0G4EIQ5_VITBC|nr:unnamed protein product [Vitrella brassicaformis CCMP3155]|eukprot:CEL95878.1 unnamed protein product [Vitrella brassicaformis CCMP3155]